MSIIPSSPEKELSPKWQCHSYMGVAEDECIAEKHCGSGLIVERVTSPKNR
eukprot:m.81268 g.81268  ORF g.81268 m.81268 type:complete len:51 (+) comp10993_c0_seq1:1416-1568(+)